MDFKCLLEPDIKHFIGQHENDDVRTLALKKPPQERWPYALIIDQIKVRQKARTKIPQWLDRHPDIIFPPGDIIEQASSTATARYKASLVKGKIFADLTGGAGVDTHAFTARFERGICIDRDPKAAALLEHNLQLLSPKPIEVHTAAAEELIKDMPPADMIYIDPQRRNDQKKGLFRISDCAPNILALLPMLQRKTDLVMLKTSPMLDITQAIKDLQHVREVHIVQWRGECKEVLYLIDFTNAASEDKAPHIVVDLDDEGAISKRHQFTKSQEETPAPLGLPEDYLYEPGPAFQKAGGFNSLAHEFEFRKLHKHTHLYTSKTLNTDFPGRHFKIINTLPINRKSLTFDKANLTIRNFPGDVAALRKKLKLREGGEDYLFACTLMDEQKILLHVRKENI